MRIRIFGDDGFLLIALGACFLTFLVGLYCGHKIAVGYYEPQIEKLNVEIDKLKEEQTFWKDTLRGLAEGGQLEGTELSGRPSLED